jgi:hypothetical protein
VPMYCLSYQLVSFNLMIGIYHTLTCLLSDSIMADFRAQFEISELIQMFNIYSLIQDCCCCSPGKGYWATCISVGLFSRHTACSVYFKYRAMMPTFSRLER